MQQKRGSPRALKGVGLDQWPLLPGSEGSADKRISILLVQVNTRTGIGKDGLVDTKEELGGLVRCLRLGNIFF